MYNYLENEIKFVLEKTKPKTKKKTKNIFPYKFVELSWLLKGILIKVYKEYKEKE